MTPEFISAARENADASRQRFMTDLLFAARVLGYDRILDRVHEPVASFAMNKRPGLPIAEWDAMKQRLQLDPRGTFKTTLAITENVQIITASRGEARICKLTATKPLAAAVAGEIADHFVKASAADPTLFQELFPEFLITPREKRVGEYKAPCRTTNWKEETVMSFSIETSISGWHFDVLDVDDVVDTQNSKTSAGLQLVKTNFRINKKTLMPWGYVNFRGTRYNPRDLWGDIIAKADPSEIRVLVRAALTRKDGRRLDIGDEFPRRDQVELLFPELLSYEFLRSEWNSDPPSFMSQYMNDAAGGNAVTFPKEMLLGASVEAADTPVVAQAVMAARLAYTGKPNMQNAAAAVGVVEHGRLFVVDGLRGQLAPSALAHRLAQMAKTHGVQQIEVEQTPGAEHMQSAIQNYALALGWPLTVVWRDFEEDDGVRDQRIKSAEPLLASSRLLLADCRARKEMVSQFAEYGMTEDIEYPDVISRLAAKLPRSIASIDPDQAQDVAWEMARQRDLYDRTHGLGHYAPPEMAVEDKYEPPRNAYGLDDMLGGLNG